VTRDPDEGSSLVEPLVVWALYGVVAIAVLVTYWRIPPEELYNVSRGGAAGAFGYTLVFLNFPTAFAALALLPFLADRLGGRAWNALVLLAAVLCLVVAAPGVVEQDDLDAKPVNALPGLGVALAFVLTLAALFRAGSPWPRGWLPGDPIRIALAVVLALGAIPWIGAELGVYVTGAPVLGSIFLAGEVFPEPGHADLRAVHLGHHHGMSGVLFALTALVLSREVGRLRARPLRLVLAGYLGLMLVYGLANALQDFWLEQLYKRDATSFRFPAMLRPDLGPEWLAIVLATAALYALVGRPVALRRREL